MKTARQLSVALLVFLAISALYGSYHMITDPTGASLGLPFYLLNGTLFTDYLLAGWVLLVVVGLFSMYSMAQVLRKGKNYSFLIMLQGVLLCIFVTVQMFLLGETFLIQYVYLFIGVLLIGLGAMQNQRRIVVETEKDAHPVLKPKSHHHKHRKHK